MKFSNITREALWAKQAISASDVNYKLWEEKKLLLQNMSHFSSSCFFAVDVYKKRYSYASENFSAIFGYKLTSIQNVEKEGDFLENRIHPEDWEQMIDRQIKHSQFIYSLPSERRNDYQTIYQFRILNSRKKYINVISRQQVMETDRNGKAWIIMGMLDISPQQEIHDRIKYSVLNRKTGEILSFPLAENSCHILTEREKKILRLIREGWLSKEIADQLNISIYTVNNHRKNILTKLNANNSFEAIQSACRKGIF